MYRWENVSRDINNEQVGDVAEIYIVVNNITRGEDGDRLRRLISKKASAQTTKVEAIQYGSWGGGVVNVGFGFIK
jgi:hypothetical protein